ncbi:hypothetical protein AMJ83_01910 [candidate division WOR_3 bacterium SM23_42]|uniref:Secretion system C-terminal sorting domain-containing protein n=1 Tax=candidate division WOR_3 bacterium SM23_42 TaxID=1703779 RepID=A0A0S8FUY8_UNCW3|nr:MAG: hypothetical protein AMJ83_01910 [candidate division WOR_3 bacterium SM23_42]
MTLGGWYSDVRFYTNVGTNANPVFTNYIYLVMPDSQNFLNGNPPRINFADWDGDTDLDMITCDYYGSVFLRENITPQSIAENDDQSSTSLNLTITPNPFHHSTDIRYQIADNIQKCEFKIYDITGRLVTDFSEQISVIGCQSSVKWEGTDQTNRQLSSGVYFITLKSGIDIRVEKVMIVR